MKAGKLKAKEVKDFLNASYDKTPPKDLDGYILDNKLSTDTAKVYYNPQTNHAVIAHRGTKGTLDWGNNLAYALGAYEMTPRYWKGKSVQDKAEKKYGKQNISTLGHSQGAILARKLGSDTKEVINVNPAYTFEKPKNNEYNIRSSTDVVSGLYAPVSKAREVLYPEYSKKHDITIPSQSATDVLGEHSYEILDRMGDAEIGVGAGNKFSSNSIMKSGGRRAKALGYQSDDIDWCGSGHFFSRDRRRVEPAPPSREDLEEIIEDINDELQYFQGRERYERMNGLPADEDREERIRDLEISRAIALNLIDNLTPGTTPVSSIRSSNFELSEEDDYTPFSFEMSEETPSVAFYNNGTEMPSPMYSSDEEMEGRGLQGTPYLNQGTNPFGTRGAGFHDGHSSVDKYFKPPKGLRRGQGRIRGGANIEDIVSFVKMMKRKKNTTDEIRGLVNEMESQFGVANNPAVLETLNELYTELVEASRPFIRPDESSSDEEIEEGEGGKRSGLKSLQKGFTKMGTAFGKAGEAMNPMSYAIKDKGTRGAMVSSGDVTQNYLLPATVSAGKPIYDATAMTASTMLTGNPILGKAVADSLWDNMVAKKGYDPRERQKSQELGELSGTFGQAVSKPYSASLGGMGRNHVAEEFDRRNKRKYKGGSNDGMNIIINNEIREEEAQTLRNFFDPVFNHINEQIQNGILEDEEIVESNNLVDQINNSLDIFQTSNSPREVAEAHSNIENAYANLQRLHTAVEERANEINRNFDQSVRRLNINLESGVPLLKSQFKTPTPKPPRGSGRKKGGRRQDEEDIDDYLEELKRELRQKYSPFKKLLKILTTKEGIPEKIEEKALRMIEWNVDEEIENIESHHEIGEVEKHLYQIEKFLNKIANSRPKEVSEDEEVEGGARVDFDKIKWGSFTRMFNKYKKEHPKARVKDLEQFAKRIIKNKKEFSDKALKKAMFYLNVIKKG
jgi:hypothetical protein